MQAVTETPLTRRGEKSLVGKKRLRRKGGVGKRIAKEKKTTPAAGAIFRGGRQYGGKVHARDGEGKLGGGRAGTDLVILQKQRDLT